MINDKLIADLFLAEKYQDCHAICLKTLQSDQKNSISYYYLSMIALKYNDLPRAIDLLKIAVENDPKRLLFQVKLVELLFRTGDLSQAHQQLLESINCTNVDVALLNRQGAFFNRLDCHQHALSVYTRAMMLSKLPCADVLINLATTYKFLGEFQLAKNTILEVLAIGFYSSVYLPLVEISDSDSLEGIKIELEKILSENICENEAQKSEIQFALALCFEKLGEYSKSFTSLKIANQIKRKLVPYNKDVEVQLFSAIKTNFTKVSTNLSTLNSPTFSPIFILGMPRTGSTLIERILSRHIDVVSTGEIQTFPIEFRRLCQSNSLKILDAEVINASSNVDYQILAQKYIQEVQRFNYKNKMLIDKLPYNFLYIGAIKNAFPHAKIIHVKRNPVDTCLSNFKQNYAHVYPYSYDLNDMANYFIEYSKLMIHWHTVYPNQIFDISYEDLILNSEEYTRKLLSYCELPWQEECLAPEKNKTSVSTASSVQVRGPINRTAIKRWQHYESDLSEVTTLFKEHGIDFT
ncbi:MAG: tetratricopeptide (TPR) repeat protein [Alteromonadaceae bacterium]|jgi:tetratricopeptide (TPR) repeat protein